MPVTGRVLYLVGGAPGVGKSSLAQLLVRSEGISWLPTDVVRTVLRRVCAEVDRVDCDPVDADRLAEVMYPHIEQAAAVCAEQPGRFLIEGVEVVPWYPARLRAALHGVQIRACFLGHRTFPAGDLAAARRGPRPQHGSLAPPAETRAEVWVRQRSQQLAQQCRDAALPYVDVGEGGFDAAMQRAWLHLMTSPIDRR